MSNIDWSKIDPLIDSEARKHARIYHMNTRMRKVSQAEMELFNIDLLWEFPKRELQKVDSKNLDDLIDKMQ